MSDLRDGDRLATRIYASRDLPWGDGIQLRYGFQTVGMGWTVAAPITMVPKKHNELVEPFMTLHNHEAQQLMDQLWVCGLRPTEGTGSAGSLAATERHLEDMRSLVFKQRGIK